MPYSILRRWKWRRRRMRKRNDGETDKSRWMILQQQRERARDEDIEHVLLVDGRKQYEGAHRSAKFSYLKDTQRRTIIILSLNIQGETSSLLKIRTILKVKKSRKKTSNKLVASERDKSSARRTEKNYFKNESAKFIGRCSVVAGFGRRASFTSPRKW